MKLRRSWSWAPVGGSPSTDAASAPAPHRPEGQNPAAHHPHKVPPERNPLAVTSQRLVIESETKLKMIFSNSL